MIIVWEHLKYYAQAGIHQVGYVCMGLDIDACVKPLFEFQIQSVALIAPAPCPVGRIIVNSPLVNKGDATEQQVESQQNRCPVVVGCRSWIAEILPANSLLLRKI